MTAAYLTTVLALYVAAIPAEVSTGHELVADDIPAVWASLADCESGEWDADGVPIEGSARWDYGAPGGFAHDGFERYEGGLNFDPDTWTWGAGALGVADAYPHAYQAPAHVQVQVAEEVQARQGWGAWPVCSRRVGLS